MIRGELTNLRAVERSDTGLLHRWFNDADLMRFWGVPEPAVSLDEIARRVEHWLVDERTFDRPACVIVESLDAAPLGVAILSCFEPIHASVELSFFIAERDEREKGAGTDALVSLLSVCFDQWRLHRVSLQVEAFNERAARFFERVGFTREGTLREASFFDGAYHDQIVYGRLATDRAGEQD